MSHSLGHSQIRRTLDTLLDPHTTIDASRKQEVRNLVSACQDASLAYDGETFTAMIDRCAEVIRRWRLY